MNNVHPIIQRSLAHWVTGIGRSEQEVRAEAEDDQDAECPTCQGTGEGQWEGASCQSCRGNGVNKAFTGLTRRDYQRGAYGDEI